MSWLITVGISVRLEEQIQIWTLVGRRCSRTALMSIECQSLSTLFRLNLIAGTALIVNTSHLFKRVFWKELPCTINMLNCYDSHICSCEMRIRQFPSQKPSITGLKYFYIKFISSFNLFSWQVQWSDCSEAVWEVCSLLSWWTKLFGQPCLKNLFGESKLHQETPAAHGWQARVTVSKSSSKHLSRCTWRLGTVSQVWSK